ncbi:TetR/AcrR family transcriptional regulator [Yinghuangia soli]|uniref:TetR/AcrR family transcriptional regulator n=1 Tax=Yinghuangia soli TaxID=2908204 RepID=A0AA41U579_9ACTN|nr:TetR/AcrR family transcriptional regulator [Yinghuangia soli]MCF2529724.1 TetR/AcrR family transcriptional regulator [Yinghuangia soli]
MGGTTDGGGRMRADAQRNRQLIIDAARDIFIEAGADAPLDEIARQAGVGIATLYRRFPDRDALIRAVVLDTFGVMAETARNAEEHGTDAFDALRRFMHGALDAKMGAIMPMLAGRVEFDDEVDQARLAVGVPVQRILTTAQAQGLIRPEAVFGDIAFMVVRLSRPLPAITKILVDDDLAHRHLDIYLDGLRASDPAERLELRPPAVSLADFDKLRGKFANGAVPTD